MNIFGHNLGYSPWLQIQPVVVFSHTTAFWVDEHAYNIDLKVIHLVLQSDLFNHQFKLTSPNKNVTEAPLKWVTLKILAKYKFCFAWNERDAATAALRGRTTQAILGHVPED